MFPSYLLFSGFKSQYHPFVYYWISISSYNSPCRFFRWEDSILRIFAFREAREVWPPEFPDSATRAGSIRLWGQEDPTVVTNVSCHQFLLVCRWLMAKTIPETCMNLTILTNCFNMLSWLGYLGPFLWFALLSTCPASHHGHFCSRILHVLSFVSPTPSVANPQFSPNQSPITSWVL